MLIRFTVNLDIAYFYLRPEDDVLLFQTELEVYDVLLILLKLHVKPDHLKHYDNEKYVLTSDHIKAFQVHLFSKAHFLLARLLLIFLLEAVTHTWPDKPKGLVWGYFSYLSTYELQI